MSTPADRMSESFWMSEARAVAALEYPWRGEVYLPEQWYGLEDLAVCVVGLYVLKVVRIAALVEWAKGGDR